MSVVAAAAADGAATDGDDDLDVSAALLDYRLDTTRLRTDPKFHGFDNNVGDSWIYPTNYPVRRYQYDITHAALFRNTLVVLPTGLGKTFLAAVVMYNMYRWYPRGRVIFMAPTRPLVAQQIEACYQIMGIPKADTAELTGKQSKQTRELEWRSRRVFFVTPQMLALDMLEPYFPAGDVKLVVVDEAHKARGKYAYTEVIRWLHERNPHFRVMALSATPGRTVDDVTQVVRNLRISELAVRSESSPDVRPYTHAKNIRTVVVKLGDALRDVRAQLMAIIEPHVDNLLALDVITGTAASLNKGWLVMQQKRFLDAARQQRHPQHSAAMADFSTCISLYHALELLERHGVRIFLHFFEDSDKFYLRGNPVLRQFLDELRTELGVIDYAAPLPADFDFGHPKYALLRVQLREHFERCGAETRALVFCEYKESVFMIERLLQAEQPLLQPRIFVGQGSVGGVSGAGQKAVTQKQQIATMADFRSGAVNVLIATCVAEEGIDVGEIDLIVCFDISNKNPTRFVQRIGRTGRKRDGHVLMLVTEGREQLVLRDVLANKDATNARLVDSAALRAAMEPSPRMVPTEFDPKCIETFIKIAGVVPLAKEGEESTAAFDAPKPNPTKGRVKKTKMLAAIKGVQDVRQFFKPVRAATGGDDAASVNVTPDRPQKSVVYDDSFHDPDMAPYVSSSPDTPICAVVPPPPAAPLLDARILQNLKNLPKVYRDLLGTAAIASRPVLSAKAVLKRGHTVPKSLQEYAVINSMNVSSAAAAAPDRFDALFADLATDGEWPEMLPLEKSVDADDADVSAVAPMPAEAAVGDEFPGAITQFGTQIPRFIDNESRYESYVQSPQPFGRPSGVTDMMSSTPVRGPPAIGIGRMSAERSLSAKASRSTEKRQARDGSVPKRKSRTPGQKTPNKTTPIREAFVKVLEMRSTSKSANKTSADSPTVKLNSKLTAILAYFQLRSILDIFDDSDAESDKPAAHIQANLLKRSPMLGTLKTEAVTPTKATIVTKQDISDLFHETIVVSSEDGSVSGSQPLANSSRSGSQPMVSSKTLDIGHIDNIFGSDDDLFESFTDAAPPTVRCASSLSSTSKHSSDEVIQSSQNATASTAASTANAITTVQRTLSAKLAERKQSRLMRQMASIAEVGVDQTTTDTSIRNNPKPIVAAAPPTRQISATALGQPSSQKENQATLQQNPRLASSSEVAKADQSKSPPRRLPPKPPISNISPSVLAIGRSQFKSLQASGRAVQTANRIDLSGFEPTSTDASRNQSITGVRRPKRVRRVLESSTDDDDHDNDAAAPTTRQISADMFDVSAASAHVQPSSQKENDAPLQRNPRSVSSPETTKADQFKSPPRRMSAKPPISDVSPSVLANRRSRFKSLLGASSAPTYGQAAGRTPTANTIDLSAFERTVTDAGGNQSIIGVRRPGNVRRAIESSTDDDDDDDDFERSSAKIKTPVTLRPHKPPKPRRARCAFVNDECDVSADEECSADEDEADATMLNSMICNDEQTVSVSMYGHYLQSVRSPCNQYGAYRMNANRRPMNRSEIFSQHVPPAEESDDSSMDSFVVRDDDDADREAAGAKPMARSLSQLDPLERAEMIIKQRRRAKRLGIALLSGEDELAAEAPTVRPKKRRKIMQIASPSPDKT